MSPQVGKPESERDQPRDDTNRCKRNTALRPATSGSLGLNLAAAVDVVLYTDRPTKIPTGIKGPITINVQSFGALLLGRSSASLMSLFVLPGVIDADFTGEICIMRHTPFPPLKIEKGQRIAQLVPLPQLSAGLTPQSETPIRDPRDTKGFGSTGLTLLTLNLRDRPKKSIKIAYRGEEIVALALLDTGADSSIISPNVWPQTWPSYASSQTVTGVGGFTLARKSPTVALHIDRQQLSVVFSIVSLPPTVDCLISRDVLAQLGVVLTNAHPLG
ncbi:bifunctional protease/dUTPase-like protein [Turdus rufiventris]|nr:bifunctional protease/dUTPase-like protein [Turdus rufiventris]